MRAYGCFGAKVSAQSDDAGPLSLHRRIRFAVEPRNGLQGYSQHLLSRNNEPYRSA